MSLALKVIVTVVLLIGWVLVLYGVEATIAAFTDPAVRWFKGAARLVITAVGAGLLILLGTYVWLWMPRQADPRRVDRRDQSK